MLKPRAIVFILIALTLWFSQVTTLAQSPSVPVASARERGLELYRAKDIVAASKVLKTAVKTNPADEQAWFYLGLALTQQPKELKNASKAFETAIKLKPDFAAAHTGLSYVLLHRNKFSEALGEAQIAIKLDPGIANAHYVVAVVRLNAGAYEEALAAASEAIRLNQNLAGAYLVKSEALWGMYAGPLDTSLPTKPSPAAVTPPTPEELEKRREKRSREAAILAESVKSLERYLKLSPAAPSAALWREQLATLKVLGNVGTGEVVKHGDEVTTKARVLAKPEPRYTDAARGAQIRGTVVLRAVFSADGKVRNILIVKGLPYGLTEQALNAARSIRFTPALVNGVPVSVFVQLEYNFNLY
ncbi:MAG TPA: TonB family protein [Pyrinomonadaceae bacterium]|nr:TonB family protein [Pyrinomonadaceae bacterium]